MSGLVSPVTDIICSTNKRESNDMKNKTYCNRCFMGIELEKKIPTFVDDTSLIALQ